MMARRHNATSEHRQFLDETLPHLDAVWSAARRLAADPAYAEDLVQETYLRAFGSYRDQGRGELRSWLVAICVNAARSDYRRSQRRPRQEHHDQLAAFPSSGDTSASALARIDRDAVARCLQELPEVQRVAVVMMDIAGLTAREVGERLGVPRGTVLARVHRGRRRLAVMLEQEGVGRDV